jgi:hypothetical protein
MISVQRPVLQRRFAFEKIYIAEDRIFKIKTVHNEIMFHLCTIYLA